jgi:tripartite-type tricarboxylate transporter receptor subunit TctC
MQGHSILFRLLVALSLTMVSAASFGQAFPNRPIKVIVPYAAGGGTDTVIRPVATAVAAHLGQPVVIENRPGGNTFIGMSACAKALADGYTLCVTNADVLAFGPYIFNRIPYNPQTDLTGITKIAHSPNGIFVSTQMPFKTIQDLIAYAQANPKKLNFATFGAGTVGHLYIEYFRRQMGAEMTHVPYRGAGPIIPALITNEVQVSYLSLAQALPHLKNGKIRILAVVDSERHAELPDVPTLAESKADAGIKAYFGLYAPTGTPTPVLQRLNAAFGAALNEQSVQASMSGLMFVVQPSSIDEINQAREQEFTRAGELTRAIGLKPVDIPE